MVFKGWIAEYLNMGRKDSIVVKAEPVDLNESVAVEGEPTTEKEEYEALMVHINAIAEPVAPRKLAKKLYKLIRKASAHKQHLRQGVVEVQRALRKGETGLVVLAGNVSPIDVYSHIPAVCEEKEQPYVFTPSKEHLGLAAGHKRPTIMVLIRPNSAYDELLQECSTAANKLPVRS